MQRICRVRRSSTTTLAQNSTRTNVWMTSHLVNEYAESPVTPVTLDYLLNLEQDINVCALYAHNELPKRLARRVRAIERLPFIVGVNPYISRVYELYKDSFYTLVKTPSPVDQESIKNFTQTLSTLTDTHQAVIPNLAQGFMEAGKYMTLESRQKFLDQMISARIGIRVIAEHFLSLQHPREGWIGVVNTKAHPYTALKNTCTYVQQVCEFNYGTYPEFEINGDTDATLAYINVHLEYIFMELVKNAMRATVEHSMKMKRLEHPIVEITIGKHDDAVVIRFRDAGGGIKSHDQKRIWEYSYTTVDKNEDDFLSSKNHMQQSTGGPIAGLGFGLPMSRVYSKFFGGSLQLKNISGIGVDAFVEFPNITMFKHKYEI